MCRTPVLECLSFDVIEPVRPSLHHLPSLGQILRMVVCRASAVLVFVRQLHFDHFVLPSHFMEVGGRCCPKVMAGYRFRVIRNHVVDSPIDRCTTHVWALSIAMQNRQDIPPMSVHLLQLAQQFQRLFGKRDDVRTYP